MARPQADNWDGPFFRPFLCSEICHRELRPAHLYSLNALEPEGCWLYTLSGYGVYRWGTQRRTLGVGQALTYHSPDRGQLNVEKRGLPWRYYCIHVAGEPALKMFDYILERFGMFQQLPPDCDAVRLAAKLVRLTREQPHRSAHFWSQQTFRWLDALWESAERFAPPIHSMLHEPPHPSRLISMSAGSVKSMAEQLGYSRSYLTRKLCWQWDRPPGGVLRRVRLEEAARLLRTSDMRVSDVSAKLGFAAASVLSRAFRKSYGMTPLEYRQKALNAEELPTLQDE